MKKFIKLSALTFAAVSLLAACGPAKPVKSEWTEEEKAVFVEYAYGWELPVPNVEGGTLQWQENETNEKGQVTALGNFITFTGAAATSATVDAYAALYTEADGWTKLESEEGVYGFYGEKVLSAEDETYLQGMVSFGLVEETLVLQFAVEHSLELYTGPEELMQTLLYWTFGLENAALDEWYRYDAEEDMYWTALVLPAVEPDVDAVYDQVYEIYAAATEPLTETGSGLGAHPFMNPDYTELTTGEPAVAAAFTFGTFTTVNICEILCYIMEGEVVYQMVCYNIF